MTTFYRYAIGDALRLVIAGDGDDLQVQCVSLSPKNFCRLHGRIASALLDTRGFKLGKNDLDIISVEVGMSVAVNVMLPLDVTGQEIRDLKNELVLHIKGIRDRFVEELQRAKTSGEQADSMPNTPIRK